MATIAPAIISSTFAEIKAKMGRVEGLTPWVHIDIMDGIFVPGSTWQTPDDLYEIGGPLKIETHLMVEHPEATLRDWLDVVDRVVVHYEATDQLPEIINAVTNSSVQLGIALRLETPIEVLLPYATMLSHIQLMSIASVGAHGQPFAPAVLPKISALRSEFPNATIAVDGGITLETGKAVLVAGADVLCVGSALWNSDDVQKTLEAFQAL